MNTILSVLSERPIAYHPILQRVTGSIHAAVFLSYLLLRWKNRDTPQNISISVEEVSSDAGITREQQNTVIEHLTELGFIVSEVHGTPATRYFIVFEERIVRAIVSKEKENEKEKEERSKEERVKAKGKETPPPLFNSFEEKPIPKPKQVLITAKNSLVPLSNEEIYAIADKKNVTVEVVFRMQETIFDKLIGKTWQRKWGTTMYYTCMDWIRMNLERGYIQNRGEFDEMDFLMSAPGKSALQDVIYEKYQKHIREDYRDVIPMG